MDFLSTRTKIKTILRELYFAKGDTVNKTELTKLIQKSKENLQNTSLFTTIKIDVVYPDSLTANVYILLEERWYYWPGLEV